MLDKALFVFWVGLVIAIYVGSPEVRESFALLWASLVSLAGEWRAMLVIGVVLVAGAFGLRWLLDRKYG